MADINGGTVDLWRVKSLLNKEGWRAFALLADAKGGRFVARAA